MKCIYLWQPWATLWVLGEKRNETRSYATKHRGELIVGAAKLTKQNQEIGERLYNTEPFYSSLAKHGYKNWKDLPTGALVGIVEITECRNVLPDNIDKRMSIYAEHLLIYRKEVSEQERAFGDWSNGRWIWMAENHKPLTPIPYRGQQGMFHVDFEKLLLE